MRAFAALLIACSTVTLTSCSGQDVENVASHGLAASPATSIHIKGRDAEAEYSSTTPDGCITTFVVVVAEEQTTSSNAAPGPPVPTGDAFVSIDVIDRCTPAFSS